MKKVYVLVGVVLVIVGLLFAIAWMPDSKEFLPPTEATLTIKDAPRWWMVVGHMTVDEDTTVVVKFKSLNPGAQVLTLLVSEESYQRIIKASETQGIEALTAIEPSDYLAKSSAEDGELKWTSTQDGSYWVIFTLLWSMDTEDAELTITQNPGYAAKDFQMREGSLFGAEFECRDPDDQLAAILVNEYWSNQIQEGVTPPADKVVATAKGNTGKVLGVVPETGTYYLYLAPSAGHYPVPATIKTKIASVPEGSELPVSFTYSVEGSTGGPWYVGVIITIVGVAVMILGFRKPPVQVGPPSAPAYAPSPAPTYTPQAPTVAAPTKFCTNCGAPNPADSRFCKACGQRQD